MARAERNEEKNVKNYNYEWQTDEEIVANAHTKRSFHGREETTLADIIGTDDAEVFRQAHKLWLKLKEAFNKEGADYDPALCNSILGSVGSKECREVMRSLWWAALNGDEYGDYDQLTAIIEMLHDGEDLQRKNEPAGKEKFLLSGKLRCAECGSTFRRQQLGDTAYWICMKKASGNSRCKSRRVKEDAVYDTFTKLLYKLKTYRTVLIEPLIETLQDMDYTDSQKDIRSIDKSIADYSAKQTVLSKLYSSGALGTDEWNIKKSEVEFELNKLRKARKKLIGLQKQEYFS